MQEEMGFSGLREITIAGSTGTLYCSRYFILPPRVTIFIWGIYNSHAHYIAEQ